MKRFIQLFYLIFIKKNIKDAKNYYDNNQVLNYYVGCIDSGLTEDENELAQKYIFNSEYKDVNLLIVGAGAGREIHVVHDRFNQTCGYEPVTSLSKNGFIAESTFYTSSLDSVIVQFSIVWVSKYVISFMNKRERQNLYKVLDTLMVNNSYIFIKPDIMDLNFKKSFKYWAIGWLLRLFSVRNYNEPGDTIRTNLDHVEDLDLNVFFYHYFKDEKEFIDDVSSFFNFKELLPGGFFVFQKKITN